MNIEDEDLQLVATLELVINRLQERCAVVRKRVAAGMRPGNRADAVDPLDATRNLGTVLMTKPGRQAWVSNRQDFAAWVKANYPDKVKNDFEIPADAEEIKALFFLHARDRLKDTSVVDKDFEADVLSKSREVGAAVGPANELDIPGVVVQTPQSVLRCVPDPLGPGTVDHMLRTGQLDLAKLVLDEEPAEVPQ